MSFWASLFHVFELVKSELDIFYHIFRSSAMIFTTERSIAFPLFLPRTTLHGTPILHTIRTKVHSFVTREETKLTLYSSADNYWHVIQNYCLYATGSFLKKYRHLTGEQTSALYHTSIQIHISQAAFYLQVFPTNFLTAPSSSHSWSTVRLFLASRFYRPNNIR